LGIDACGVGFETRPDGSAVGRDLSDRWSRPQRTRQARPQRTVQRNLTERGVPARGC